MIELPTDYQKFIHASRYARYRDDLGRRENWNETVTRYFDYFQQDLEERHGYKPSELLVSELKDAVLGLHIMPSMRALMTAGEAARRENLSVYNCAYLPIDRVRAFGEALYILMCGTGLGFSVERQVIKNLPECSETLTLSEEEIVVGDSKRGWAEAYEEFIVNLFAGRVMRINVSNVRAKGERLMTFGGRASGPEPLIELFEFTRKTFQEAKGRRLKSSEVHEICTMIGSIVVVGGVRRSAEISLSNLSDLRMRNIKSGNWYDEKPHLALANNSVAYTEMPEPDIFMEEWLSLYRSKSGERGIFNRFGAIDKIERSGRRDPNFEFGTNPCAEILLRPRGLCNLTEMVIRETDNFKTLKEKARLASILGTWQSTQVSFNYVEPEWAVNATEERLLGVSQTGIYDNKLMRGDEGKDKLIPVLQNLKAEVIKANVREAKSIGITASVATTTVKPSGTVSQLVLSPPGIHHGHAPYYFRRVSQDNKDPITAFMKDAGIPNEPHNKHPDSMTVFTFPMKLGSQTKTRDEETAIQSMELVLLYLQHWSEHAVSCTISVRENEWPAVGGWVYDHFTDVVGMSFLPHFEGDSMYPQKPYETCTKEQYLEMVSKMPTLDWSNLGTYEAGVDYVTGTQELACTGGVCEIVGSGNPA